MGTVKYTGPVASFHCPTNAEIRSLKVHFSPKQEGSGDPSPENIRPISGWTGANVYRAGKNLLDVNGYTQLQFASLNNNYLTNTNTDTRDNFQLSVVGYNGSTMLGQLFGQINMPTGAYSNTFVLSNTYENMNLIYIKHNGITRDIGIRIPVDLVVGQTYTISMDVTGNDPTTVGGLSFGNIQLELGSTATSYEPYQGSTTNYEFGVLGKNKFNKNDSGKIISGVQVLSAGKIGGSSTSTTVFIPCFSNTSYTISKLATARAAISYATTNTLPQIDDSVYGYQNIANQSTATITTGDNAKWLCVYITNTTYDNTSVQDILDSLQVELGSTATAYEPYDPNHTVYGGWVDLISGEVEEEYGMVETTWGAMTGADVRGNYERRQLNVSSIGFIGASAGNLNNRPNRRFCNIAPWRWAYYDDQLHYYADMGTAYVFLPINSDDNITIRIVCYLATPNTYHLAPTQLQTFLGQNNVWSNADYVEVEYDLHETQSILARKQFIMANQPHIVTPVAAPLQNFVTDVPAPLKECKVYFEPKQDLHGYSNPWPAGGGKNIAKPYDNNYISSSYISFDYSAANGTFRCYGTASASSTHSSPSATNAVNNGATFTLPAGTYTLSIIDGDGANIYAQCVSSDETVLAETTSYTTFTTNESLTVFVRLKVAAAATVDNTVKIQLEAGSVATSYVLYENICPISGWSGLMVYKAGANIWDEDAEAGIINTETGENSGSANRIRSKEFVPVRPDTTYFYSCNSKDYNGNLCFVFYDKNKNHIGYRDFNIVHEFTTPEMAAYLRFYTGTAYGGTYNNDISINYPSTDTSYHPYYGITIPITFPSITNLLNFTTITANKTLSSAGEETSENGMSFTNYIKVNEGDTYKLTFTSKEGARTRRIYGYDVNKDPVESLASVSWVTVDTTGTVQATIPSGVDYIRVCYKTADENIFLEGPESSVIYGGYVDLVRGEVVQTHYLASVLKSQFGNQITPSTSNGMPYRQTVPLFPDAASGTSWVTARQQQIFNYGKIANPWSETTYGSYVGVIITGNNGAYMRISEDIYQTLSDNDHVEISYELATPITYQIDQTTLKTLRGTNNIWASNNGGNIEVAFWRH